MSYSSQLTPAPLLVAMDKLGYIVNLYILEWGKRPHRAYSYVRHLSILHHSVFLMSDYRAICIPIGPIEVWPRLGCYPDHKNTWLDFIWFYLLYQKVLGIVKNMVPTIIWNKYHSLGSMLMKQKIIFISNYSRLCFP